jgi:hypothetical protein
MSTPLGIDCLIEDIVVVILSPSLKSSEGLASGHPSWSLVAGPLGGAYGLSVRSCSLSVRTKKFVWSRWYSVGFALHVLRVWSILYQLSLYLNTIHAIHALFHQTIFFVNCGSTV